MKVKLWPTKQRKLPAFRIVAVGGNHGCHYILHV